ncbi:MAG: helix-hairpin-helix domain-containing protein [Planctomycetaceae bacterium]|nr:helix-hairpin-helix domain-containing protein [Planctomycetaceae bacterium]
MDRPSPSDRPPGPRLVLRRLDQAAAAAVLAAALALLAGHWLWNGHLHGRLIEIERAEPIAVKLQIDVNGADWSELCLLPGIGEQLAKRIVVERTANGPFRDWDDLRRVRGIGPRTLESMKPYLLPMADLEATAGSDGPGGSGRGWPMEGKVN